MRTIMGNAAKAPFRAIGRLFGRDEDDLELVEFDAGRSDLLPAEQEKLAKVAENLKPRLEAVCRGPLRSRGGSDGPERAKAGPAHRFTPRRGGGCCGRSRSIHTRNDPGIAVHRTVFRGSSRDGASAPHAGYAAGRTSGGSGCSGEC